MTFADFIVSLYADVSNKNTRTLPVLRECTIRQLKELSVIRTLMMEASANFSTVAGQETYTPGQGGVPADILAIDQLYWTSGSQRYEIPGPVAVDELRFVLGSTAPAQYPAAWGWQANQLLLGPPPAGVVPLGLDYMRDATRDTTTGTVISTASTAETNPWFDRGERTLRNAVLAEYFAMPTWRDQEAAALCTVQKNQGIASMKAEWTARKYRGGQAPICWGESEAERSYAWP